MKIFHISRISSLVILSFLMVLSCDIIEMPFEEGARNLDFDEQCLADAAAVEPFPAGETLTRKVLLEEITGHQCGNCPEQSEIAYDLYDNQYAGQMVMIAIHAGFFADTKTNGKYETDYEIEEGTELDNVFNDAQAYPYGMVDRTNFNAGNASQWGNFVNDRLTLPVEAGIRIFNCYNADSAKLTTVIDVKYLISATDKEYLAVYLIEDDVEDWQKDYRQSPIDIPDYKHHNVLRATLNGVWGLPLSQESVNAEDTFTQAYSYEVPDYMNVNNLKVVAFVHNFDTKEVRQVEEAPLVQ